MTSNFNSFLTHTWRTGETEALHVALELDIFDDVKNGMNTIEKICEKRKYHPPSIDSIFGILKNNQFLTENNQVYTVNSKYEKYVLKESRLYIGSVWRLYKDLARNLWKDLKNMVVSGKNESVMFSSNNSERWAESMPFLNSLAENIAESLFQQLKSEIDGNKPIKILDMACGTGIYSAKLLQENKTWSAVGIDIEKVVKIAQTHQQQLMKEGRLQFYADDIFKKNENLGKFDVIILSNILHGYSMEENGKLLEVASDYLKENGKIIVNEFLIGDTSDNIDFVFDLFFSLAGSGRSFTSESIEHLFNTGGFQKYKELDIEGPSTCIIFERKS